MAVVVGAVVMEGGGSVGAVVVVVGAVPVPATGGNVNAQGIMHIDRVGQIESLNLLIQLGTIHRSSQFGQHVRHAAEILEGRGHRGGAHAGGREGRSVHAGR